MEEPVVLHCLGAFVATQVYGVLRNTLDLDYTSVVPVDVRSRLTDIAGKTSPMRKTYGLYLDAVGVATTPYDYDTRLTPVFPNAWKHLHLLAMEAHDVALSKLERNLDRDRLDVRALARSGQINAATLEQRYHAELRPYVIGPPERHDLTLKLWLEAFW